MIYPFDKDGCKGAEILKQRYTDMVEQAALLLETIQSKRPLIHTITNYVTANDCANAILAVGGSPIMADDPLEAAQITAAAEALVLNMGTPDVRREKAMLLAGKAANKKDITVVFDPVGAAVSDMRRAMAKRLTGEVKMDILRGNLSEISFLAGDKNAGEKGVDVSENTENFNRAVAARKAAEKFGCVAAVTGTVDVISDGTRVLYVHNGTEMLSRVTGTGCMTSAVIGALAGAGGDPFVAAAAGVAVVGIAGQEAFARAGGLGLGSFHMALIDALGSINAIKVREMAEFEEG